MRKKIIVIQYSSEQNISNNYGPLLSLEEVRDVLKYKSVEAVKKAYYKGSLPIRLIKIEGRSGLYCTAKMIAEYIDQVYKEENEK